MSTYVASAFRYPSRSHNCGRLLIAATQSSLLHCRSRLVRSHGNNVRDVIIAHVISADAHIYRRRNRKVILGPAGRVWSTRRLVKSNVIMADFCHSHWVTSSSAVWLCSHQQLSAAVWSCGHWQFSSVVTRSRTVFGRSQIMTPVAALSPTHIGETILCEAWE